MLNGGDGDDTIDGGSGVDVMNGGNGNDTFRIFNGWTGGPGEQANGGAGTDTFDVSNTSVTTTNINLAAGTFTYTPGGSGTIALSSIENVVTGASADTITGNASANTITAGAGNDSLQGGLGSDTLFGGTGADLFIYGSAAEADGDFIADFTWQQNDKIDLAAIDANDLVAGNQAFSWIGTGAFTAAGQLHYVQSGGDTFVQGNTGSNLAPDFTIKVAGSVPFIASDFVA